jgi:dehydrodolichyl diphosphate syntase complex subunit NUS1
MAVHVPTKLAMNTLSKKNEGLEKYKIKAYHLLLELMYILVSIYNLLKYVYHVVKYKRFSLNYKGVRTPELIVKDISSLPKLPRHIAAILKLNQKNKSDSLDDLLIKSGDLAYWAISSGASVLTIYERNGVLKALDPNDFKRRINKKLEQYYGFDKPVIKVNIPPLENSANNGSESGVFVINLISQEDGRGSLVKLTRELSSRVAEKKLRIKEITIPFVDIELTHNEFEEPDLLYVFSRRLDLDGFPPWQIRLSEIFNLEYIDEVSYPLFLRGLESYAGCKINLGS